MDKYEALEGKEVKFKTENKTYKGIVVGCDPDIGITITNAENKTQYLLCIVGPKSPQVRDGLTFDLEHYKADFDFVFTCLDEIGRYSVMENDIYLAVMHDIPIPNRSSLIYSLGHTSPTQNNCAFS